MVRSAGTPGIYWRRRSPDAIACGLNQGVLTSSLHTAGATLEPRCAVAGPGIRRPGRRNGGSPAGGSTRVRTVRLCDHAECRPSGATASPAGTVADIPERHAAIAGLPRRRAGGEVGRAGGTAGRTGERSYRAPAAPTPGGG